MKAVLISIQPQWCEKIANGEKTVECRKTYPKLKTPFKCYIYCTKTDNPISLCTHDSHDYTCGKAYRYSGGGEVIGEFVCDGIYAVLAHPSIFAGHATFFQKAIDDACLTRDEVERYSGGKDVCGWHITDLQIYDKPKELSDFYKNGTLSNEAFCETVYDGMRSYADYLFTRALRKPPQSWCYVEELHGG